MKARQKIAIRQPCYRAWETLGRQFVAAQEVRGLLLSSILTVNK